MSFRHRHLRAVTADLASAPDDRAHVDECGTTALDDAEKWMKIS
jgi:hypothetical protein